MWRKCKLTGFIQFYINSYNYPIFDDFCLDTQQRLGYWTTSNQTTLQVPRLAVRYNPKPCSRKRWLSRTGDRRDVSKETSTAQDEVGLWEPRVRSAQTGLGTACKCWLAAPHDIQIHLDLPGLLSACWGVLGCPSPQVPLRHLSTAKANSWTRGAGEHKAAAGSGSNH